MIRSEQEAREIVQEMNHDLHEPSFSPSVLRQAEYHHAQGYLQALEDERKRSAKVVEAAKMLPVILLFYGRKDPVEHHATCKKLAHPEWPANKFPNRWCEKCQYEGLRQGAHEATEAIKNSVANYEGRTLGEKV